MNHPAATMSPRPALPAEPPPSARLPQLAAVKSGPGAQAGAARFSRVTSPQDAYRAQFEFTGSGSEYFRIWIVNLLLTLVTAGLYHPWAKVRKLRYLYGNTHLAGHSLDFHGEPGKMLRGTILAGVLFSAYAQAGQFSPLAALVATLVVSALWPLLLRGSLQFRLGHTSWRGMRFAFTGSKGDAVKALALPLLLFLVPPALGVYMDGKPATTVDDDLTPVDIALLGVWLTGMLATPYFLWRLKKYQHGHYRLGALQSELRLGPGRVYGIYLRTFGLAALLPLALGLLALIGIRPGFWLLLLGTLYVYVVVFAYLKVGQQNLFWSRTGNHYVRFRSELPLQSYMLLQLKNHLLVSLTLGLYWPWAMIANRRMALESVTLITRVDLDELTQVLQARRGDAAADAADDLLGFDLGL